MQLKVENMKIPRTLALSLMKKAEDLSSWQIGLVVQTGSGHFSCPILKVNVEKLTPEACAEAITEQLNQYYSQNKELIAFFCLEPIPENLMGTLQILPQSPHTILAISMN
ncbi:MAG TPA: hypothetical protein DCZ03_14325, partial [Gammaproteobacteria bacterium]|nr:hypothetical protein [Gammaproteobacteria bacterium]